MAGSVFIITYDDGTVVRRAFASQHAAEDFAVTLYARHVRRPGMTLSRIDLPTLVVDDLTDDLDEAFMKMEEA